jgi:hypothetical protein
MIWFRRFQFRNTATYSIDLLGPLPSAESHKYVLTIVDRSSSWLEAIVLKDMVHTIFIPPPPPSEHDNFINTYCALFALILHYFTLILSFYFFSLFFSFSPFSFIFLLFVLHFPLFLFPFSYFFFPKDIGSYFPPIYIGQKFMKNENLFYQRTL